MKKFTFLLIIILFRIYANAQNCDETINYIKSKDYGIKYSSYNSDAISHVTFYSIYLQHELLYFAVVCFKKEYSFDCAEYIYQVGSNTKLNYSMNYLESAGNAFWKYIQPYNSILKCAPELN